MYRTVAQLDAVTRLLAEWFPQSFLRIRLPEPSVQGRPVHALRLRSGSGPDRRGVLVVGGTHARELMNPDAIVELAVDLFVSHATGSDLVYGGRTWTAQEVTTVLESLDLWFVPCVNPDGREHVLTVDDMWRKNRRDNPGSPHDGVDLNRNADILWGVTQGRTSCDPASDVYCGPAVFSEPETRNVRWLLDAHRMVTFCDVHSYSELVLWPWGHAPSQSADPSSTVTGLATGTCAPIPVPGYQEYLSDRDRQRFATVGDRVAQAIREVRGRGYTSQPSVALYPVTGALSDYAFARHVANPARPTTYGFTLETGPYDTSVPNSFHPADPGLIKRDAKAGLVALFQQSICAIDLIGLRFGIGARSVDALRTVRDDLLATTEAGREWAALVEQVQAPLAAALLADDGLATPAAGLLTRVAGLARGPASGMITAEDAGAAARLARAVARRPEAAAARAALRHLADLLPELAGLTWAAAVERLMTEPPRRRRPADRSRTARPRPGGHG